MKVLVRWNIEYNTLDIEKLKELGITIYETPPYIILTGENVAGFIVKLNKKHPIVSLICKIKELKDEINERYEVTEEMIEELTMKGGDIAKVLISRLEALEDLIGDIYGAIQYGMYKRYMYVDCGSEEKMEGKITAIINLFDENQVKKMVKLIEILGKPETFRIWL